MTDAEWQQARTDGAREERTRWEQALADSHLPELYKRLVRDLATEEPCECPDEHCGDCGCCADQCKCGHDLSRHDMGHGCIECRCRGWREAT
jgi:hypothetical protein